MPVPSRPGPTRVFLSYAHADHTVAESIVAYLMEAGLSVWHDSSIQVGDAWRGVIRDAIENSTAVVWLVSPKSVASVEVAKEIAIAQESNKAIRPIEIVAGAATSRRALPELRSTLEKVQFEEAHDEPSHRRACYRVAMTLGLAFSMSGPLAYRAFRRSEVDLSPARLLASRVHEHWIEGLLESTMRDNKLGIEPEFEAVTTLGESTALVDLQDFPRFYAESCRGRLLITGGSGSGKTIFMLKLVDHLLAAHLQDPASVPVPVVFDIPSWPDPMAIGGAQLSIEKWLEQQFYLQYGIPSGMARSFLSGKVPVVYCLDGYDELTALAAQDGGTGVDVARMRQAFHAHLIQFARARGEFCDLILTTKTEYAHELRGPELSRSEIVIEPLGLDAVRARLDVAELPLLEELSRKPGFDEYFTNPATLQMLVYTFLSATSKEVELVRQNQSDPKRFMGIVFDEYFVPKLKDIVTWQTHSLSSSPMLFKPPALGPIDVRHYLCTIARLLASIKVFRLDQLQPSLLDAQRRVEYRALVAVFLGATVVVTAAVPVALAVSGEWFPHATVAQAARMGALALATVGITGGGIVAAGYRWTNGALFGAMVGLAFGVARGFAVGLSYEVPGSQPGLAAGVLHGLATTAGAVPLIALVFRGVQDRTDRIDLIEVWKADTTKFLLYLALAIAFGIEFALVLSPARGIAFGFMFGLFAMLRFGRRPASAAYAVRPNQAIRQTLRHALTYAISIALVASLVFGLSYGYFHSASQGFSNASLAWAFLVMFFFFGGLSALKHYALRIVLDRARILPLFSSVLFESARRAGVLRQIGGGYVFANEEIRSHFAALSADPPWSGE